MQITEDAPIEVSVSRSRIDGALLVQVDTEPDTGPVRIFLNDGAVWDGDPEGENQAPTAPVLEADTYNRLIAYLLAVPSREALLLANEIKDQIGASAQRRAGMENR